MIEPSSDDSLHVVDPLETLAAEDRVLSSSVGAMSRVEL